jgi:hypothetical protein
MYRVADPAHSVAAPWRVADADAARTLMLLALEG